MPRPKCRILGCVNVATIHVHVPEPGISGEVGLCPTHHAQYEADQLETKRIGAAQTVD